MTDVRLKRKAKILRKSALLSAMRPRKISATLLEKNLMTAPVYHASLPNDHFALVRNMAHAAASRTDGDEVGEELRSANAVLVVILDNAQDLDGGMGFAFGVGSVAPLMNAAFAAGPETLKTVFAARNEHFANALAEDVITWARTAITGAGPDLSQYRIDTGQPPLIASLYHA
jgi:hypothetical protein